MYTMYLCTILAPWRVTFSLAQVMWLVVHSNKYLCLWDKSPKRSIYLSLNSIIFTIFVLDLTLQMLVSQDSTCWEGVERWSITSHWTLCRLQSVMRCPWTFNLPWESRSLSAEWLVVGWGDEPEIILVDGLGDVRVENMIHTPSLHDQQD